MEKQHNKEPQDCCFCNAGIVMMYENSNWMPIDVDQWTPGENEYDPNVHVKHTCRAKSRGQYEKTSAISDFDGVV